MAVRKRKDRGRWCYDIQVRGLRHRGAIPEVRNKAQIKLALFEREFELIMNMRPITSQRYVLGINANQELKSNESRLAVMAHGLKFQDRMFIGELTDPDIEMDELMFHNPILQLFVGLLFYS